MSNILKYIIRTERANKKVDEHTNECQNSDKRARMKKFLKYNYFWNTFLCKLFYKSKTVFGIN